MNDKTYNLILKILDSDLTKETKDEITRFYLLPRNTHVPAMVEIPEDETHDLGTVKRPTSHQNKRKKNPSLAETEDAMIETLSKKTAK